MTVLEGREDAEKKQIQTCPLGAHGPEACSGHRAVSEHWAGTWSLSKAHPIFLVFGKGHT